MSFFLVSLIIGFSTTIIVNFIFAFSWNTILDLFICFSVVMLPAGVFLFVGRALPKKFFNDNNKLFIVGNFKNKICNISKVKLWKDLIPVGGRIAGFRLNKLTCPNNIEYLDRFIYESCFAEWLHFTAFVWSFIAIFLLPKNLLFKMTLPISLLFAYQNITSVIIQWFVRPRIVKLRDKMKIKQFTKDKEEISESVEVTS